ADVHRTRRKIHRDHPAVGIDEDRHLQAEGIIPSANQTARGVRKLQSRHVQVILRGRGLSAKKQAASEASPIYSVLQNMLTAFIKYNDGRISTKTDSATLSAALGDPTATFWL